jgi:hypothetical protein
MAEAVMNALMSAEHRVTVSTHESEIEPIWMEEPDVQAGDGHKTSVEEEGLSIRQCLAQPVSRRELLRGRLVQSLDAEQ